MAFCPVVTIALHSGSCRSSAVTSVASTTSRNLSDALSCNRRMDEAVSNKAIPFSFRKSIKNFYKLLSYRIILFSWRELLRFKAAGV